MARKDIASIISGAGWIAGFADKLIRGLRDRNVNDEQIHSLVTDNGQVPMDRILDVVAEYFHAAANVFTLPVNSALPLAEAIAAGKYDWVNPDITPDRFPIFGEATVEVEMRFVHFNCAMESDNVLKELDQAGLRPATLAELLAFGAKYPDKQREFPIIALGSVWQDRYGDRNVPGLWNDASVRRLRLNWFDSGWDEDCRFLACRK